MRYHSDSICTDYAPERERARGPLSPGSCLGYVEMMKPSRVIIHCKNEGISFVEALRRIPPKTHGLFVTIDPTGLDEDIEEDINILTPASADQPLLNLNPTFHRTWAIDYPLSIRAVPELCQVLSSEAHVIADPRHNMLSVIDPKSNWEDDAHKDRFLVGQATPHSGGFIPPTPLPIIANDSNTLILAGSSPPVPPFEILGPGAHLRFGANPTGGIPFNSFLNIVARCSLGVQWIRWGLSSVAPKGGLGLSLHPRGGTYVNWSSNRFDIGLRVGDGGSVDIDEAVFNDVPVAFEGFGSNERNFRRIAATRVNFAGHRGDYFGLDLRLRGCTPFGTQTTTNYSGYADIENAEIIGSQGDGLRFRGGSGQHRLRNTVISECSGNAVVCTRNTHLIMQNVHGEGNDGAGLYIRDGGQVQVVGSTDVSGASEINAGGSLGEQPWSAVPIAEFSPQTAVRVHR